MKFTCVVTGVEIGTPAIWQCSFDNAAVPISLRSELKLTLKIADARNEPVLKIIDVSLEQSCIVSITKISEQPPQEFILKTVDADFFPDGGWWLDEQTGWLVCPSLAKVPPLVISVLIRVYEYKLLYD
jgi:hypothetical protein